MKPGCAPFEHELSAYVDAELDPAARAAVEQHLRACAACAAEVRELRRVGETLRRWDAQETRYATSTGFRNRVLARLGGDAGAGAPDDVRTWRRAAWAAAVVAGIAGAAAWGTTRTPSGGRDLAELERRVRSLEGRLQDLAAAPAASPEDAPATGEPLSVATAGPLPELVAPPAGREAAALGETPDASDAWTGPDGTLHRDAVPDYERFVGDARRLSLEERLTRVERKDAGGQPTVAGPAPAPLANFLGVVSLSPKRARTDRLQRLQVWPIELPGARRGPAPLLASQAGANVLQVSEDGAGGLRVRNADVAGRSVLLLAGDVLPGGHRDRVVREDVLVGPGEQVSLSAFGASPARPRARERRFDRATLLAPFDLRALLAAGSLGQEVAQRDVDEMIGASLAGLGQGGEASLRRLWTSAELQREVAKHVDTFRRLLDGPDVVGFALAAGSDVLGAEICGDPETFRALRDRLIQSHVLYALSLPSDAGADAPPTDTAVQSILAAASHASFSDPASAAGPALSVFRSGDGHVFGYGLLDGTRVVHATVFAGMPAGEATVVARRTGGLGTTPPGPAGRDTAPPPGADRSGSPGAGGRLGD